MSKKTRQRVVIFTQKIPINVKLHFQLEEEDEQFQHEFDKIFHSEKVDVAHLNPNEAGDIDQERKNYYRYNTIFQLRKQLQKQQAMDIE